MLWTTERQQLARASCAKWGGTRHRNRIAVAGQGIDCINFVFEVLADAGICDRFKLPHYNEALGILRERNIMERLLLDYLHAAVILTPEPAFGDVAIFNCGMQSNHIGIVIDGKVWHVPGGGRCGPEVWPNVSRKLQSLVRVTAPGFSADPSGLTWEIIRTRAETIDHV